MSGPIRKQRQKRLYSSSNGVESRTSTVVESKTRSTSKGNFVLDSTTFLNFRVPDSTKSNKIACLCTVMLSQCVCCEIATSLDNHKPGALFQYFPKCFWNICIFVVKIATCPQTPDTVVFLWHIDSWYVLQIKCNKTPAKHRDTLIAKKYGEGEDRTHDLLSGKPISEVHFARWSGDKVKFWQNL